ncbi:hypothetical protein ABIA39_003466 [Nocardia sp. GAS34]|uniref:hypothetical protein n=1 Tax=unclassified Nocardia TaxID=2637762 RepID=UPI003D248486
MSATHGASQSIPSTVSPDDRTPPAPLSTEEKEELMMLVKTPDLTPAQIERMIDLSRRHTAAAMTTIRDR